MIDRATSERLEDIVSMLVEIGDDSYENRTFLRHLVENHGASLVFSTLRDEAAKSLESCEVGTQRSDDLLILFRFYAFAARTSQD